MSGSTIGGVVGGIVGAFFGPMGSQIGFMIGSMIGGFVDPDQVYGPRLTDAQTQTSQVGVPIPFGYGTFPTAGNIIWAGALRERKRKDNGKGGPEQVTYQYLRSYAIGICEGPIKAIKTIKRNGKVVYEAGTNAAGDYTGDTSNLSAASRKFLQKCTIYLGDETQMPDPTIEAVVGVGNVSPFRGLAYIVIKDDDLTDFQGAVPQYEFVVVMEGETGEDGGEFDALTYQQGWPWATDAVGLRDFRRPYVTYQYGNAYTGQWYPDVGQALNSIASYLGITPVGGFTLRGWSTLENTASSSGGAYYSQNGTWNPSIPDPNAFAAAGGDPPSGGLVSGGLIYSWFNFRDEHDYFASSAAVVNAVGGGWFPDNVSAFGSAVWHPISGAPPGGTLYSFGIFPGSDFMVYRDIVVAVRPVLGCEHPPPGTPVPDAPGYFVTPSGEMVFQGDCESTVGTFKQLSARVDSTDGASLSTAFKTLPLGPVLIPTDPNYSSEPYWTAAYLSAVANGLMPAGMTYSPTGSGSNIYPVTSSNACRCAPPLETISRDRVVLASIVADLCERSGLPASRYDVSQLTDLVDGYKCATIGDGVSYITPLSQAYFFDPAEWDGKIRFVKRGGDAVFALGPDDMAERDGDAIEEERVQEAELLRKTTVAYIDPKAGFSPATQVAERRVSTIQAKGESATEVPVVMSNEDAAAMADKRIKVAWSETDKLLCNLPYRFSYLTPTDVGTFTDKEGVTRRVRIMQSQEDSGVLILENSRDSQAAYVSNATGIAPTPPTVTTPGPVGGTLLELLNIAVLRDGDDQVGIYAAARGQLSGWTGAAIQISLDGGATSSTFATITEPSTIGFTLTPLAATVPDSPAIQSVDVFLPDAPQSVDYATLLRNSNRAVIGEEIIQYQTVTVLSPNNYRLSGLVRNRYGTAPVAHAAGERFVLIDSTLTFVRADQWMIGQSLWFKAVSFGTSPDAYTWQPYTFATAVSQTEWKPQMVQAKDVAGDIVVTWLGRARLGTPANPNHSQHFIGYRVTYTNGVNVVTHDVTSQTDTLVGGASLPGVVTITVTGRNAITGPGTASEAINA